MGDVGDSMVWFALFGCLFLAWVLVMIYGAIVKQTIRMKDQEMAMQKRHEELVATLRALRRT